MVTDYGECVKGLFFIVGLASHGDLYPEAGSNFDEIVRYGFDKFNDKGITGYIMWRIHTSRTPGVQTIYLSEY